MALHGGEIPHGLGVGASRLKRSAFLEVRWGATLPRSSDLFSAVYFSSGTLPQKRNGKRALGDLGSTGRRSGAFPRKKKKTCLPNRCQVPWLLGG